MIAPRLLLWGAPVFRQRGASVTEGLCDSNKTNDPAIVNLADDKIRLQSC